MNFSFAESEFARLESEARAGLVKLSELKSSIAVQEKALEVTGQSLEGSFPKDFNASLFKEFFKKPYALLPVGKNRAFVAVPKFIKNFQVGWLWKATESFYIYELNQHTAWLGDVPSDLAKEINFKQEVKAFVQGNVLFFDLEQKEAVKRKLGNHLKDVQDTQAVIVRGHEFDVLVELIEGGCLPFQPLRVAEQDLRQPRSSIKLRDYQQKAFDKFLETGAVGVFHPTGAGKSFISLYAIDSLKGKKLIVVPTKTLVEQWNAYLDSALPHCKNEVRIATYQGYRDSDEEYSLVVFDECQRLPADTFSRLATVKTKYRLGLSASPHREDGRESYIFALTGFPIGLNWQEYMTTVGKSYHPINVHLVRGDSGKLKKVQELLDYKKKTFIFCDSIDFGKQLSKELNVPFVHGQSENRLESVANNKVLIVSRVMDVGVSVKDLEQIIEVDFLFGSRQQELQRTGRLMHSEAENVRHDIVFTDAEMQQYGKRLWALREKGFTIKIIEKGELN